MQWGSPQRLRTGGGALCGVCRFNPKRTPSNRTSLWAPQPSPSGAEAEAGKRRLWNHNAGHSFWGLGCILWRGNRPRIPQPARATKPFSSLSPSRPHGGGGPAFVWGARRHGGRTALFPALWRANEMRPSRPLKESFLESVRRVEVASGSAARSHAAARGGGLGRGAAGGGGPNSLGCLNQGLMFPQAASCAIPPCTASTPSVVPFSKGELTGTVNGVPSPGSSQRLSRGEKNITFHLFKRCSESLSRT